MKKSLFTILSILILSTGTIKAAVMANGTDEQFNSYKERFVLALWNMNPVWASSVGYHQYDGILTIPNEASRANELAFCKAHLDTLKQFPLAELSDINKTDHHLIENQLKYTEWGIKEQKAYEWDPSGYNVSGCFAEMLGNDYAPLEDRLRSFFQRMAFIPAYYRAAESNIKRPTAEHTALAIEQNMGGISVFETDLADALKKSKLDKKEKDAIVLRAKGAVEAIKDYVAWLKRLDNDEPRSFRLGKKLYDAKFGYEIQSGYSADAIYQKALKHKEELHDEMYKVTKQLWPKYFAAAKMPAGKLDAVRQMINKLSEHHVAADSFQAAIEAQIPALVAFIKNKNLIYIDPSKPLVIRKEPAYMAGVAGASINAPGPYDKNGNTYYNVGSLAGWDKNKAESY